MHTILRTLGLSDIECQIVELILEFHRPLCARHIGLELEIARQTSYSILTGMVSKGLLTQTDHEGTKFFYIDAASLIKYVESEQDRLKEAKRQLLGEIGYLLKQNNRHGFKGLK